MKTYKENFQEIKDSYILKKAYNSNVKINPSKIKDLLTLCKKLAIHPEYHSFYENLAKNNDQADYVDDSHESEGEKEKLINECEEKCRKVAKKVAKKLS